MDKLDLRKTHKDLYAARPEPEWVQVTPLPYLMVDGQGDPNGSAAFQEGVQALYSVAYGLSFALKAEGRPFKVMGLEGLWWADDPSAFTAGDRSRWHWTLMILQPPPVSQELFEGVIAATAKKKDLPGLTRVRLETYAEGLSAQVLHVGPFDTEGPAIAKLHAFIAEAGRELAGKHHEIYLSDPRRVEPERWRTILRQPAR